MEINEPNDLLHFFYRYGLKELPVSHDGEISGKLKKSSLVKFLSRSEQFESNVMTTMERLVENADRDFLDQLTEQLEAGEIKGIPILKHTGQLERVVTPGLLEAKEEAREFLDESEKRQLYEDFLETFPFPVSISKENHTVFTNESFQQLDDPESWHLRELENNGWVFSLYMPGVVHELFQDYQQLLNEETIDLRERIESIEEKLLLLAEEASSSISQAAERLGLPRQTYHYRRDKFTLSDDQKSQD